MSGPSSYPSGSGQYGTQQYGNSGGGSSNYNPSFSNYNPQYQWGHQGSDAPLSVGGSSPSHNMAMAARQAPGAPPWLQEQMAGYYGAPFMTGSLYDFPRWNWAQNMNTSPAPTMQTQSANPYQPQQPSNPYTPQPQQPAPQQPQQPAPTPAPTTTPPAGTSGSYAPIRSSASGSVVGSPNWWAAVANAQQPGTTLPDWLAGGLKRV